MSDSLQSERFGTVHVRDVMTSTVLSAPESAQIDTTDAEMKFARIRHMPIVDGDGRLRGIVSAHDLMRAMAKERGRMKIPVAMVMRADVFTVRPEALLSAAIGQMIENKISALPVVDEENKLVGIVTDTDVMRWAYVKLTGHAYRPPPIDE